MRQRRQAAPDGRRVPDGQRPSSLYQVLQVSPEAAPEVIHAAYRALAKAHHPDVNPAPEASRLMRQIIGAYAVLGDPVRRARYDAQRARAARILPRPAIARSPAAAPLALPIASLPTTPTLPASPVRAALVLLVIVALAAMLLAAALAFLFSAVSDGGDPLMSTQAPRTVHSDEVVRAIPLGPEHSTRLGQ